MHEYVQKVCVYLTVSFSFYCIIISVSFLDVNSKKRGQFYPIFTNLAFPASAR